MILEKKYSYYLMGKDPERTKQMSMNVGLGANYARTAVLPAKQQVGFGHLSEGEKKQRIIALEKGAEDCKKEGLELARNPYLNKFLGEIRHWTDKADLIEYSVKNPKEALAAAGQFRENSEDLDKLIKPYIERSF